MGGLATIPGAHDSHLENRVEAALMHSRYRSAKTRASTDSPGRHTVLAGVPAPTQRYLSMGFAGSFETLRTMHLPIETLQRGGPVLHA